MGKEKLVQVSIQKTIYLEKEIDYKLKIMSAKKGQSQSQLVNDILRARLFPKEDN